MGYEGAQIGKVFVGTRADGTCVKATGITAHHIVNMLPSNEASVARLDLAVTVWFGQDDTMVALRAKDDVLRWRGGGGLASRQLVKYIDGCGSGDTLYIGARTSHIFARIYDKGRESKDEAYRWSWRYEVEIKNRIADKAFRELNLRKWTPDSIAATVSSYFQSKGHTPPYNSLASPPVALYEAVSRSSSDELLIWLQRQVGPSVRRLLRESRASDILAALGIAGNIVLTADSPTTTLHGEV
jgi:DNA relaxase NicK